MKWQWRRERPDDHEPCPSAEALQEAAELRALRPRVERAATERDRLLRENNYTARIRALYQENTA